MSKIRFECADQVTITLIDEKVKMRITEIIDASVFKDCPIHITFVDKSTFTSRLWDVPILAGCIEPEKGSRRLINRARSFPFQWEHTVKTILLLLESTVEAIKRYRGREDPIQNIPGNPESIIYDSGCPLVTMQDMWSSVCQQKVQDMWSYICQQKGSFAILGIGTQSHPESDYFGTPGLRSMIIGNNLP